MVNFEISFTYQEKEYKAEVSKVPFVNNLPVQYHVFKIYPEIPALPLPIYFIHNPKSEIFEFGFYLNHPTLNGIMFNAIKEYCSENGIPLTT